MASGGEEASEDALETDPFAEVVRRRRDELVRGIDPGALARYLLGNTESDEERQHIHELSSERGDGSSVAVQLLHWILWKGFSHLMQALCQPEVGVADLAVQLQRDARKLEQAQASGQNMPDDVDEAYGEGGIQLDAETLRKSPGAPIIQVNNYITKNINVNKSTNVVIGDQNTLQVSQVENPNMDGNYPDEGDYEARDYEEGDYTPDEEERDRGDSSQSGATRASRDDDVIILGEYEEDDELTEPKRALGGSGAAEDWTEPKHVDSGDDWRTSPKQLYSGDTTLKKEFAVEGSKELQAEHGTRTTDDITVAKELGSSSLDTDVVTDFASVSLASSSETPRLGKREYKHEQLSLRAYQKELAEPAVQGKNTIVCAPTGSGKTHVAMYIIKEHLDKRLFLQNGTKEENPAKVLVLAPEVTILNQHYESFCRYLPLFRTGKRSGSAETKRPFDDVVEANDITVATPAILQNALRDRSVKITDFSLIVFDECHHTKKDAPYNKIMAEYLKIKRAAPQATLPQIVGLSASPGAGGKPNLPAAEKHLQVLIASLDAEVFKTVEKPENIAELEEKVNTPSKHVLVTKSRQDDPFKETVEAMMAEIERLFPRNLQLQYGGMRGVQEYQSAVDLVRQQAEEERNTEVVQQCQHLVNYNKALQMNTLARMKDAMEILTDFYDELKGRRQISDTEKRMLDLFKAQRGKLLSLSQREDKYPNPKLVKVKEEILKARKEFEKFGDELRGILFVKTRALTQALISWFQETPSLQFLNPGVLTGAGGEDFARSTHVQQTSVIKKFNDGNHKLLIATSIAEEGLDIRDCNMVIKYNYATNEIAMVQARGRARAAEGKELVIADVNVAEQDRVNALTVEVSDKAIKNVQSQLRNNAGDFQQKIKELQLALVENREHKEKQQEIKKGLYRASDVKVCCKGCLKMICRGSELRLANNNRIYPSREWDQVEFKQHKKKDKQKMGIAKIHCKCGHDLGNTYKGYPCLKIGGIKFIYPDGSMGTKKQWKDVPFELETFATV